MVQTYPATVDLQAVRDAYSAMSGPYIELYDGDWQSREQAAVPFVRRHLGRLSGEVLDVGCGPGQWTGLLHSWGADATGVDLVPEFIAHAGATQPGPRFRLGSMLEPDVEDHTLSGILSWYSTIHLPPAELDRALAVFHRLLDPAGILVIGFFDSDENVVARFDHKVTGAYRWPVETLSRHLATAGLTEVERLQQQLPERPDRRYAAIAARVSRSSS